MEIEVKERSQVKAKIYGKEYQLSKPTVGQVEKLQSEIKGLEEGKQLTVMKNWINTLGLPLDVIDSMEMDHFLLVVEGLTGSKKK